MGKFKRLFPASMHPSIIKQVINLKAFQDSFSISDFDRSCQQTGNKTKKWRLIDEIQEDISINVFRVVVGSLDKRR